MVIDFLTQLDFRTWMWWIPLIFFLHEMEEWNILDWYHATFNPPPNSTKLSCRLWLFLASICGFAVTALAYVIPNSSISAAIVLVFIALTALNGMHHIFWLFAFQKYAPGVIFSTLGILAGAGMTAAALAQGLVSPAFVILLYLLCVPILVVPFRAGNRCIGACAALHNFTLKIVEVLER